MQFALLWLVFCLYITLMSRLGRAGLLCVKYSLEAPNLVCLIILIVIVSVAGLWIAHCDLPPLPLSLRQSARDPNLPYTHIFALTGVLFFALGYLFALASYLGNNKNAGDY